MAKLTKSGLRIAEAGKLLRRRFPLAVVEGFPMEHAELDRKLLLWLYNLDGDAAFRRHPLDPFYSWIPTGRPRETHMIEAETVPQFSMDLNACHMAERRVEERGLALVYLKELYEIVLSGGRWRTDHDSFTIANAHPYHKCVAMLRAMGVRSLH